MAQTTKAAWIFDEPGLGHFECPCGNTVPAGAFGDGPSVACHKCRRVFSPHGWISEWPLCQEPLGGLPCGEFVARAKPLPFRATPGPAAHGKCDRHSRTVKGGGRELARMLES